MQKIVEFCKDLKWMKEQGYDSFAIYSQCWLETGNFTCKLTPKNNFAGMMPRKSCPYPSEKFWTHEYELGKRVDRFSEFNVYPTPLDFFKDYDTMVKEKFPLAYEKRGSYLTYFPHLMTYDVHGDIIYPSWCSAKGYERKLIDVYEILNKSTHFELKQMI